MKSAVIAMGLLVMSNLASAEEKLEDYGVIKNDECGENILESTGKESTQSNFQVCLAKATLAGKALGGGARGMKMEVYDYVVISKKGEPSQFFPVKNETGKVGGYQIVGVTEVTELGFSGISTTSVKKFTLNVTTGTRQKYIKGSIPGVGAFEAPLETIYTTQSVEE